MFICKENVEKDEGELNRQVENSWAQKQGFPTKSGIVMTHGVTIQNNELQATTMIKKAWAKINTKLKTKGRYNIRIPTNGLLNRTDMAWAQKSNPEAHEAHIYREQ